MSIYPKEIYAIQHNVTKKIYIGSSTDVATRFRSHINALKKGEHPVEDMQSDFEEYGENYSLFVIDKIANRDEKYKEYELMQKYNSWERGVGYNYKDAVAKMNVLRNRKMYVDGIPEITMKTLKNHFVPLVKGEPNQANDTRKDLHKLVDKLNESEVIYLYALATKLFESDAV